MTEKYSCNICESLPARKLGVRWRCGVEEDIVQDVARRDAPDSRHRADLVVNKNEIKRKPKKYN